MRLNGRFLVLLLVTVLLIIADAEAGWKFWKKKDSSTTTVAPETITQEPPKTVPAVVVSPSTTTVKSTSVNPGAGIIGAANPGLAIGVGSTGQNIRNNAQPHKPNPGTEVGLDISQPRPGRPGTGGQSGQGYRDWAADLTGAGESGRQSPKLPAENPALSAGGQQGPGQASRPASVPGNTPIQNIPAGPKPSSLPGNAPVQPTTSTAKPVNTPVGTGGQVSPSRPSSPGVQPAPGQGGQNQPGSTFGNPTATGGIQRPTLNIVTPRPAERTTATPLRPGQNRPDFPSLPGGSSSSSLPSSPGSSPGSAPGSPGGKSWADVAGGGSRPNSPTPSPRQPDYPTRPGYSRPQSPTQPDLTRPGIGGTAARGTSAGGALAGGALAGGALAGAAAAGAASSAAKVYSSNPTYSKGNTITDEDLEKLSEALYIKDTNNANRHITLNLQKKTTGSSPTDEAPQPLFTVNAAAFQIPTIQRVLAIFDNYQLDTHTNEYISPAQRQEESLLVDTFLSTNVMSAAMRFLADKGHVQKDYYEYKDTLRKLWFNLFSRGQGKIGSTGFEHVFMAELKPVETGTEVLGLHNWIYFHSEESKNRINYLGHIKTLPLGDKASIIKVHVTFNGHDKPVTTLFVGTSPELEMALYTVCFFARPDGNCPVSLGGTKFNIVTRKFRYRGNDLVGTAYPDI
ncbi:hypothetical protein KM043_018177 [Ampulex compressa]|uniref:Poly(U)-specific endoribonuclease-like protein n=1 Tax=Ampulex compressa TaxID=860918 RepID=A0A1W6EVV9_AMPCP|nr:poly(U)-specific endoribonuclease-like protein [Ampulex compressa]KAG7199329.1 hypothetical protein KM043_018177 [Ampulex compressa]